MLNSASQMRAAILISPRELRVENVPKPRPGPGQVLFRVLQSGVCSSNLPPWEGRPWFEYPFPEGAPGHEASGIIEALGKGVTGWKVGDPVAALSYRGYAEYDVAESAALVALPEKLRDVPFLGEPLGCAMNIFRRCALQPGDTVAIVGAGFLGLLLIQLAVKAGHAVVALSRRKSALEMAERFDARPVFLSAENAVHDAQDLNGGSLFNVVVEAVGKQETLDLSAKLVCERGRLVIAGYHQDGPRSVNLQMWNWRGIDVINAHERDPKIYLQGMREAVEAAADGRIDPALLITHRFSLDEVAAAFRVTSERPEGFIKAMIAP